MSISRDMLVDPVTPPGKRAATRYRVLVADPLLTERDYWREVEGFRLISVDGPWLRDPGVTICTFEDGGAPADLEGKLVEPVLRQHDNGSVTIMSRTVISAS
jgi:hypothetical protein